jgi:hypothetical protein
MVPSHWDSSWAEPRIEDECRRQNGRDGTPDSAYPDDVEI